MDVAEKADSYMINAELPGVDPKQVEINFEQNVLTIRGVKPSQLRRHQRRVSRLHR